MSTEDSRRVLEIRRRDRELKRRQNNRRRPRYVSQKMREWTARLVFVEHLSVVIESLASGLLDECKFELDRLIHMVDSGEHPLTERQLILDHLTSAQFHIQKNSLRYAGGDLKRISRHIWGTIAGDNEDMLPP